MPGGAMIYTYAATAILSASIAFGGGWQVNQWRHDANQKNAIEQAAASERELHRLEQARSSGVIAAQNVARTRETVLRRDADRARDALDSLREQSARAVQSARASHDACVVTAATATELLNQCGKEYQSLGAEADRWVNEVKLLQESWPNVD